MGNFFEDVGNNISAGFDNATKMMQEAGKHFSNGNFWGGLGCGLAGIGGYAGNVITAGGAQALGQSTADKIDYDAASGGITWKKGKDVTLFDKVVGEWIAAPKAESLIVQSKAEKEGNVGYANFLGFVDVASTALDAATIGCGVGALGTAGKAIVGRVAAKTGGKLLAKTVGKEAATATAEAVAKTAGKEAVTATAEAVGKEAVTTTAEAVAKTAGKEAATATAEAVAKTAGKEAATATAEAVGKTVAKEAATTTAEAVGKTAGKEAATATAEAVGKKTIASKLKSGIVNCMEVGAKKGIIGKSLKNAGLSTVGAGIISKGVSGSNINQSIKDYQKDGWNGVLAGNLARFTTDTASLATTAVKDVAKATGNTLMTLTGVKAFLRDHPALGKFVNSCKAAGTATMNSFGKFAPVAYVTATIQKVFDINHKYNGVNITEMVEDIKRRSEESGKTWIEVYTNKVKELDKELGIDSSTRWLVGNKTETSTDDKKSAVDVDIDIDEPENTESIDFSFA